MTLEQLFILFNEYKPVILVSILLAPWLSLLICIAIPGQKEEPFVLSFNLTMAVLSLLMALGYLIYATNNGGWTRVIQEADILLLLAPWYYVGVSVWISKLRLPLSQIPAMRIIQGLALIGSGYLGIAFFASKIRILAFTFIPYQVWLLFILALLYLGYLGYLKLTKK